MFGGYVSEERESSYTQVISWVDTILKHTDVRVISPRHEGPHMNI